MDRLLNVITGLSLLLIVAVLASVRRQHIRVEYSVAWLMAGAALLVLSLWHSLDAKLAHALGTSDVALSLLVACGAVFVVVLYRLSLLISSLKDSNIKLAQRVAILEYRLETLDEKIKTSSAS
jgi:hypothetical protein